MDTGKTVKVWVNDVGQMGGSNSSVNRQDPRVIDLSPAAFKRLFGGLSRGVGRIRIVSATN
jgi:rare lipoprotein A (peptidoglycan hydrolase)